MKVILLPLGILLSKRVDMPLYESITFTHLSLSLSLSLSNFLKISGPDIAIYPYLPTPPLRQDMTLYQFLSRV